jgi:hypothetical protein
MAKVQDLMHITALDHLLQRVFALVLQRVFVTLVVCTVRYLFKPNSQHQTLYLYWICTISFWFYQVCLLVELGKCF